MSNFILFRQKNKPKNIPTGYVLIFHIKFHFLSQPNKKSLHLQKSENFKKQHSWPN